MCELTRKRRHKLCTLRAAAASSTRLYWKWSRCARSPQRRHRRPAPPLPCRPAPAPSLPSARPR